MTLDKTEREWAEARGMLDAPEEEIRAAMFFAEPTDGLLTGGDQSRYASEADPDYPAWTRQPYDQVDSAPEYVREILGRPVPPKIGDDLRGIDRSVMHDGGKLADWKTSIGRTMIGFDPGAQAGDYIVRMHVSGATKVVVSHEDLVRSKDYKYFRVQRAVYDPQPMLKPEFVSKEDDWGSPAGEFARARRTARDARRKSAVELLLAIVEVCQRAWLSDSTVVRFAMLEPY